MLLAVILLAIDLARTLDSLAGWWQDHQAVLRRLSATELATAVDRKDQRKKTLAENPQGMLV